MVPLGSLLRLATCLLVLLAPLSARASDVAAAEALFNEGRALMQEEKYEQACPKLAESQKLDPGAGTALNLAECYERWGKTASAWATWLEAAAIAKRAGQSDRVELAEGRATALEAKLSRLVVDVPAESRVVGLAVKRGAVDVGESSWGSALPIDPGSYTVRADAPQHAPFETEVTVAADGAVARVVIPRLEALAAAPPASPVATEPTAPAAPQPLPNEPAPSTDEKDASTNYRTYGMILTGVGAVGIGIGGVFALRARSKNQDSKEECEASPNLCSPTGVKLRNEALSAGNTATVLMGVGAAAAVVGIVLWATAPEGRETAGATQWVVSSTADGRGGALTLTGGF